MAELGARSLARLAGVKPVTITRAKALAELATVHGMDISIAEYGGLRDSATQAQLVKWRDDSVKAGGPSYPVAPVGTSKHETGDAFDIRINRYPPTFPNADAAYRFLASLAPSLGLRAGYHFTKSDPFHFENRDAGAGQDERETGTGPGENIPSGFVVMFGVVLIVLLAFGFLRGR